MSRLAVATAVALVFALPSAARAHALGAEAKLKDGRVTVEAFYDDDTPAKGARVAVTGPDGKAAAEGETDGDGRGAFPAPPAGKYQIVVDAGSGHRKTVALTIPEPTTAAEKAVAPKSAAGEPPPDVRPGEPGAQAEAVTVSEGPTRSEFTGPMRLVRLAVGLLLIGGATWAATRARRSGGPPSPKAG
jgi:hypothetical protein